MIIAAAGGPGGSIAASPVAMALLLVLAVLALAAILRRHGWTWGAPYLIGAGVMLTIGIFGALLLPGLAPLGPGYIRAGDFPIAVTMSIISVAVAAYSFGSLLGLGQRAVAPAPAVPGVPEASGVPEARGFTGIRVTDQGLGRKLVRGSLWTGWITVAVLVIGIGGPGGVLQRAHYTEYSGPAPVLQVGNLLELLAAALLGFARPLAKPSQRRWCNVLLVILFLIAFSTGSRRLALIPVLAWLGGVLGAPTKRKFLLGIPILAVLALFLAGVALFDRGQATSGLLPYLSACLSDPGGILHGFGGQLANGLTPFAGTGYSANLPSVSSAGIAYSLTPLPRGAVAIGSAESSLLLFAHHPAAALGLLYSWGGLIAVAAYMFFAGTILGWAGRLARQLSERSASIGAVLIITLSAYFCLRCLQYGLRTSTRLMWYSLAAIIVIELLTLPTRLRRRAAVQQAARASVEVTAAADRRAAATRKATRTAAVRVAAAGAAAAGPTRLHSPGSAGVAPPRGA